MIEVQTEEFATDVEAIQSAHDYAVAQGKPLYFPDGTYDMGTSSFEIDMTKINWIGDKVILQWSAAPTLGYGLRIKGNGTSYSSRYNMMGTDLKGFAIKGGGDASNNFAATAIEIYGDTANTNTFSKLENVAIQGFDTTLKFYDDVWFFTASNCQFLWGNIETPSTIANFGENMKFDNCFIGDASARPNVLNHGSWSFDKCSLDNNNLTINNASRVSISNSHLENPASGNTTYRYITISDEACVFIDGSNFIHNKPSAGIRTIPLFDNNTIGGGGIFLSQCQLANWSHETNYDTLASENHYVLQSGTGYISAKQCSTVSMSNSNSIALGKSANVLENADFEAGAKGWEEGNTTGGVANNIMSVTTAESYTGTQSLKMESTWQSGGEAITPVMNVLASVKPNDIVVGGIWRKGDFYSGVGRNIFSLRFYNKQGEQVGSDSHFSQRTATHDWEYKSFIERVPAGACYCGVVLSVGVSSGVVIAYLDEVLLNVIEG